MSSTTQAVAKGPPSLSDWATQHLTALYTAQTQDDFDSAFEAFFSKTLTVTLNNKSYSRDDYKAQLSGERVLERSATITIDNVVSAPSGSGTTGTQPAASNSEGVVGIFYTAVITEKILVFGAPEVHTANSSINLQIAEDDTIPLGPILPGDTIDLRRVFIVDQVLLDQAAPIKPPTA